MSEAAWVVHRVCIVWMPTRSTYYSFALNMWKYATQKFLITFKFIYQHNSADDGTAQRIATTQYFNLMACRNADVFRKSKEPKMKEKQELAGSQCHTSIDWVHYVQTRCHNEMCGMTDDRRRCRENQINWWRFVIALEKATRLKHLLWFCKLQLRNLWWSEMERWQFRSHTCGRGSSISQTMIIHNFRWNRLMTVLSVDWV